MSKTKKIFVCVLTAVIAVAICVSFAACGGENYNDATLIDRIAALEKQVDSLNEQLNAKEDSEVPVYKLGETFTYVSNGIPLFSVKITRDNEYNGYFLIIKNLNMLPTPPRNFVLAKYQVNNGSPSSGRPNSAALAIGEEDKTSHSFSNVTSVQIGFPINESDYIIPYCIFKLI